MHDCDSNFEIWSWIIGAIFAIFAFKCCNFHICRVTAKLWYKTYEQRWFGSDRTIWLITFCLHVEDSDVWLSTEPHWRIRSAAQMRRLIWNFVDRACRTVLFFAWWLLCCFDHRSHNLLIVKRWITVLPIKCRICKNMWCTTHEKKPYLPNANS